MWCGAFFTISGASCASRRMAIIASTNSSSVSFVSVSVGSIMSAPRHDEREVDRRRVEAVVDQALGDVERLHARLLLELRVGEHDLVHARLVVRGASSGP